jgi:hypothetical protein
MMIESAACPSSVLRLRSSLSRLVSAVRLALCDAGDSSDDPIFLSFLLKYVYQVAVYICYSTNPAFSAGVCTS